MRLINADNLIEEIKNSPLIDFTDDDIIKLIDNTPTVEVRDNFDIGYAEGHIDGVLQGEKLYARPQGEWLPNYTSQFFNPGRQCSLCGKIVEFSENYCPQCGADMRGKENERM